MKNRDISIKLGQFLFIQIAIRLTFCMVWENILYSILRIMKSYKNLWCHSLLLEQK